MFAGLSMSFFGWMPPLRASVVMSLQDFGYQSPCLHPDCQHPDVCPGNRVRLLDPEGGEWSSDSEGIPLVKIIAPHHKVSKWWPHRQPIECLLPTDLARVWYYHHVYGKEVLLEEGCSGKSSSPYFFVQVEKGNQLRMQQVSQIFTQVLGRKFSPQKARSLFITEAKGQLLPDVDEEAAAAVMGHSRKMSQSVYDKQVVFRGAANNIAALAKWRLKVTSGAAAAVGVGAAAGGGAATAAAAAAAAAAVAAAAAGPSGVHAAPTQPEVVDITMDSDTDYMSMDSDSE
jgi:hypothetical protein